MSARMKGRVVLLIVRVIGKIGQQMFFGNHCIARE